MKIYVGIDPGLEGAIAVIYPDASVTFFDTPVVQTTNAAGKNRRIPDEVEAYRRLRDGATWYSRQPGVGVDFPNPGVLVTIEQVHAMPKQGVASSFTFGSGYGMWLGAIGALGVEHGVPSQRVTPQRWKRDVLADAPKTDQAVVAIAGRLYPAVSEQLRTPRGKLLLGRADALLIAHWARTAGDRK